MVLGQLPFRKVFWVAICDGKTSPEVLELRRRKAIQLVVERTLHPTFPEPIRKVRDRASKFRHS